MSIKGPAVRVEGLKELRKELRKLDKDGPWKKDLRKAGLDAAEVVAKDAKASALAATNPRMGSRAANTIRPLASQTSGTIAAGKANVPWTMGHIWGSDRFGQFPERKKGGYHLYPAIAKNADEILEIYGKAIDAITKEAFPDPG